MIRHGLLNSNATFWLHLFPFEGKVYRYRTEMMLRHYASTNPKLIDGASPNGAITGRGFLVRKTLEFIRAKIIPEEYLSRYKWNDLTARQLSDRGEQLIMDMLCDYKIFPDEVRPFYFLNSKQEQFSCRDISNGRITIEIKTERPLTGNLFVQIEEYGHQVHLRPDGSCHVVEWPELKAR